MNQALPIGSVVTVKGSQQPLMIVTQFPVTTIKGERGYLDFGAVTLPYGLTSSQLNFFNKEDIETLLFVGYIDLAFQDFRQKYDEIVSGISYPRLTLSDFQGDSHES